MTLVKSGWKTMAVMAAAVGVLLFPGGAGAWNGSIPCTDIELNGTGSDLSGTTGGIDFSAVSHLVQCFVMGPLGDGTVSLNRAALTTIPQLTTTLAKIYAKKAPVVVSATGEDDDDVSVIAAVEDELLPYVKAFMRANATVITFKTGELRADRTDPTYVDDTIKVVQALNISGVNETSDGGEANGLYSSSPGTSADGDLLGTGGYFHFQFDGLDVVLTALGVTSGDARSISWDAAPYRGVLGTPVLLNSGYVVKDVAGKSVSFTVQYHGLQGTDQIKIGGSGTNNGLYNVSYSPANLAAAVSGTPGNVTVTLTPKNPANLSAVSQSVTIKGASDGTNTEGDEVTLTFECKESGIQSVTRSNINVPVGIKGGTVSVTATIGDVPNGAYVVVVGGTVPGWTNISPIPVTVSGMSATNTARDVTFTVTSTGVPASGAQSPITVRLRHASDATVWYGPAMNIPTFDAYDPEMTSQRGTVVDVEFGKFDHYVTYTNGATFKITDLETPTAWVKDSTVAGKTAAWKPVSITYKQKTSGISITYATGTSWAMDKGFKIGTKQTNAAGVEDPAKAPLGYDKICDEPWEVWVRMQNLTPGTGYGRWIESACTLTVNPRVLSASGITMTATLGDDVYNGKEKKPKIVLEDGIRLAEDVHYKILTEDNDAEYKNAGTYIVTVSGIGAYTRKRSATFVIQKGTLKFDVATPGMTYKFTKPYDATTAVDTSDYKVDVKFLDGNDVEGPALTYGTDYTVKNLKYNTAPVGTDKIVSMDVTLANTDNTKNWKLASTKFEAGKQVITKAEPTAENIVFKLGSRSFSLPASIPMDGKLGKTLEAEWKSPFVSSGAKFTITYPENWPTGAKDSLKIDDYEIVLNITEGANTVSMKDWAVGTLTVRDPDLPYIDADTGYIPSNKEAFYYTGKSAVIGVKAEKPEGGKGTLSYQWYLVVEDSTADRTLSGKTSSTLTVNTAVNAATDFNYYVVVTYTANNEQLPKSVKSDNIKVTGYPKPVSLAGAVIQPTLTYTYDGTEQAVPYSDFTVTLGAQTLNYGEDFTYKGARNNKFAGDGIITIKGINAYEDSAVGTFAINKKAVDILTDISPRYSVVFNGQPQTLAVPTNSPLTGLGAVTVLIGDSLWSTRTNAGEWDVSIAIAEGQNFEALDTTPLPQTFRIRKAIPDTSMFTFSVPAETPFTGEPVTVAAPVAKGLGLLYSATASNVILYNGSAVAPSRLGTYTVELSVLGDANFSSYVIPLGRMTIYDPTISVAEGSREIPNGSVTTEAAVAPVKVSGAGVMFGPNPASAGSSVSIFWNGSKPVAGKLAVFTEMGKKVETVKVSGTNKIGTWNAAKAPAGTYLVKGVLKAKDGTKVTVNSVVSVGK